MTEALRIGILGAARIADDGVVDPAGALGHRVVAVAARHRSRAEAFAEERGIEKVHADYRDLIEDPEIDVVYNCLVNSLHAEWTIAALHAGRNVLSEKPMASNADQVRAVRDAAAATGNLVVEGFHYLHHPANLRLRELVTSGALGTLTGVEIQLAIPTPAATDPRWSLDLAGGATMDLGCYVLNAARQLGRWTGGPPRLESVEGKMWGPEVDRSVAAQLSYPSGFTAAVSWDMDAPGTHMTWRVEGTEGSALSPAFAVPHLDPRLEITDAQGSTHEESWDQQTSYTHQLAALARTVQDGEPFLLEPADSVANAELIDAVYHRLGLSLRGHLS